MARTNSLGIIDLGMPKVSRVPAAGPVEEEDGRTTVSDRERRICAFFLGTLLAFSGTIITWFVLTFE